MKIWLRNKVFVYFKLETNPTLIHSHKKRIEGFILAMVEKPNPIVLY